MLSDEIIEYIKSFQLIQYIDLEKVELEKDKKLNIFIDILTENFDFLIFLYKYRNSFKKLIIPGNDDLNIINFFEIMNGILPKSEFIRNLFFLFEEQFADILNDQSKCRNIIKLLNECYVKGLFNKIEEYFYYCLNCKSYYITNKELTECKCNDELITFLFASFPNKVKKSIINGHILEHLVLNYIKNFQIKLIGIKSSSGETYTSIQYSGIGVGDKNNAEFDLLYFFRETLVFIECKFNETTYSDVKDFIIASQNFYDILKLKFTNLKFKRIIISYDSSKLIIPKGLKSIDIIDIKSYKLIDFDFYI